MMPVPEVESTSAEHSESANGTVDSLSGSTLAISGKTGTERSSSRSISMERPRSSLWAAAPPRDAKGGKVYIADFVGVGDQVTVNYRKAGSSLHADEVRVRTKAPKK
jgi:hypothetical protein